MKTIKICKAGDTQGKKVESVTIEISEKLDFLPTDTTNCQTIFYDEEAEEIVNALLSSLPQAVIEPLICKMLQKRASLHQGVMDVKTIEKVDIDEGQEYKFTANTINKEISENKASYDIEFDPLSFRLPTKAELKSLAVKIKQDSGNHKNLFICFYLPGMKINAGAYATGHNCIIKIQEYMLFGTKYHELVP